MDRLEQAADKLGVATHALAADPYSTRRNETIREINRALHDTQQVMVEVPRSAWDRSAASVSSR